MSKNRPESAIGVLGGTVPDPHAAELDGRTLVDVPTSRFGKREKKRGTGLGYVIAAYGIVIGSLIVFALWIQGQRRKLMDRNQHDANDSKGAQSRS